MIGTRMGWLALGFTVLSLESLSSRVPDVPSPGRRCDFYASPSAPAWSPTSMVASATVIVRARADSVAPIAKVRSGFGPQSLVRFTVLEVIDSRRVTLPTVLSLRGELTSVPDFNRGTVPYTSSRPGGLRGACFAFAYQKGGEFLLLLAGTSADSLTPYWDPLRPTNEQVRGTNDPWVTWVRANRRAGQR